MSDETWDDTSRLGKRSIPGQCHALHCPEPETHSLRIQRLMGAWTSGLGYCELHAHSVAGGFRARGQNAAVEPIEHLPTSGSDLS